MKTPEFWIKLSPRQQLNDAVHKYAQATGCSYSAAWRTLERMFLRKYRIDLEAERIAYEEKFGVRPTTPLLLTTMGRIRQAVDVAMRMSRT